MMFFFVLISAIIECLKTKSLSNRSTKPHSNNQSAKQPEKLPQPSSTILLMSVTLKKMCGSFQKDTGIKHKVCPIKHWQNGFPLTLVINYEQTFLSRSRKKFFFLLFHCVLGEQQKKPRLNLLTFLNLTTFEKLFNKAYILFIWMERRTSGDRVWKIRIKLFLVKCFLSCKKPFRWQIYEKNVKWKQIAENGSKGVDFKN